VRGAIGIQLAKVRSATAAPTGTVPVMALGLSLRLLFAIGALFNFFASWRN
jgi:hypothetical protein